MGKYIGKDEYHDIYPEFNGTSEKLIRHKERSGANLLGALGLNNLAASLLSVLALLGLTSLIRMGKPAIIRPALQTTTATSAKVEVISDLSDSDIDYPLIYTLIPYTVPYTEDDPPVDKETGELILNAAGDEIGAGADDAKQRLERSFCGVGRKYAERAAQQRRCSAGRLDENEVARLRGLGDRRTLERHVPDAGRHFLLFYEA